MQADNGKTLAGIDKQHRFVQLGLWLCALLLGAFQCWCYRNTFYMQDAISYLDIADAYACGDWKSAISSYWSPLYSWLIMIILPLLGGGSAALSANLKIVNFAIWVFTLTSFAIFVRQLVLYYESRICPCLQESGKLLLRGNWIRLILALVFLCQTLSLDGVYMDTPDLLSEAFIYLSSALLLALLLRPGTRVALALGFVLALGFLSKSVLFPLTFIYLLVLWLGRRHAGQQLKWGKLIGLTILTFTLISVPFIVTISIRAGRFTIGDTGRMNYAHFVARCIPFLQPNQQGDMLAGCHDLRHPPRLLLNDPQVFEFAEPIGGCFPPWLDSSYWYEGFQIIFDPIGQFVATVASFSVYFRWFFWQMLCGWLVIVGMTKQRGFSFAALRRSAPIFLPSLAALIAYALVSNNNLLYSSRYFPAYFTLWFAGALCALELERGKRSVRAFICGTSCTVLLFAFSLAREVRDDLAYSRANASNVEFAIADGLLKQGLAAGDRVVDIDPLRRYYWAHLARVKIVVEVLAMKRFWQTYEVNKYELFRDFRRLGVKAIIARFPPDEADQHLPAGWRRLSNSDAYVYLLSEGKAVHLR